MLQIDHRDSFDIDVFIDDPQVLPFLNARTQGLELDVWPDDYRSDGTKALKLVFTGLGEIDFICAAELTETPSVDRPLFDEWCVWKRLQRSLQRKKVYYRGGSFTPRDMFDIACVVENSGRRVSQRCAVSICRESLERPHRCKNNEPALQQQS